MVPSETILLTEDLVSFFYNHYFLIDESRFPDISDKDLGTVPKRIQTKNAEMVADLPVIYLQTIASIINNSCTKMEEMLFLLKNNKFFLVKMTNRSIVEDYTNLVLLIYLKGIEFKTFFCYYLISYLESLIETRSIALKDYLKDPKSDTSFIMQKYKDALNTLLKYRKNEKLESSPERYRSAKSKIQKALSLMGSNKSISNSLYHMHRHLSEDVHNLKFNTMLEFEHDSISKTVTIKLENHTEPLYGFNLSIMFFIEMMNVYDSFYAGKYNYEIKVFLSRWKKITKNHNLFERNTARNLNLL